MKKKKEKPKVFPDRMYVKIEVDTDLAPFFTVSSVMEDLIENKKELIAIYQLVEVGNVKTELIYTPE